MKKEEKNRVATKVLAYENPVFWKLEEDKRNPDVLESSISYFKEHGIAVDRITLPGRPPRYYAIWNAETEEEARDANRKLDKDEKKFFRRVMPMMQRETSLDALHEKGYDPDSADVSVDARRRNRGMIEQDDAKTCAYGFERSISEEFRNPEDIHIEKAMLQELAKALTEITDEQKKICNAVAENVTDRAIAESMGLAKSTYQGRKAKVLDEVKKKLKNYR